MISSLGRSWRQQSQSTVHATWPSGDLRFTTFFWKGDFTDVSTAITVRKRPSPVTQFHRDRIRLRMPDVLNKSHAGGDRHANALQRQPSSTSAADVVARLSERCRAGRGYYLLVGSLRSRWRPRWSWQPAPGRHWCRTRLRVVTEMGVTIRQARTSRRQRRRTAIWFAPSKMWMSM